MRRDSFNELQCLLGKSIDSEEVVAFLAKYPGHKVGKPSDGHQAVIAHAHGFEMDFSPPDGGYQSGRSAHVRVLTTLFLNSDAVAKFKTFADLPLDLSFTDNFKQMTAKLGKPLRLRKKDSGQVVWAHWQIENVIISVYFPNDQPTTKVFALMTPVVAGRVDAK
jgi:hypothetical protein